jgi:hypothetical protein
MGFQLEDNDRGQCTYFEALQIIFRYSIHKILYMTIKGLFMNPYCTLSDHFLIISLTKANGISARRD